MTITITIDHVTTSEWRGLKAESSAVLAVQKNENDIVHSSFPTDILDKRYFSQSQNGFVYAMIEASSGHHHISIRPEDVWCSILVQLNYYINSHAEEVRQLIAPHPGHIELAVEELGVLQTVDVGRLARRMTSFVEKNVADSDLRQWIMPNFSTTKEADLVVASVLMLGALQKYFSVPLSFARGISTVTLLGQRNDWQVILEKIDKISKLGKEPTLFANRLRPILRRFVASFDDPASPDVISFWQRSVDGSGGSGGGYISGWVSAFCFWDMLGVCNTKSGGVLELDGVRYGIVNSKSIPKGFTSVPVTVDDNGKDIHAILIAGSLAIEAFTHGSGSRALGKVEHVPDPRSGAESVDKANETQQKASSLTSPEPRFTAIQPATGWIVVRSPPPRAPGTFCERPTEEDEDLLWQEALGL